MSILLIYLFGVVYTSELVCKDDELPKERITAALIIIWPLIAISILLLAIRQILTGKMPTG